MMNNASHLFGERGGDSTLQEEDYFVLYREFEREYYEDLVTFVKDCLSEELNNGNQVQVDLLNFKPLHDLFIDNLGDPSLKMYVKDRLGKRLIKDIKAGGLNVEFRNPISSSRDFRLLVSHKDIFDNDFLLGLLLEGVKISFTVVSTVIAVIVCILITGLALDSVGLIDTNVISNHLRELIY